MYILIQEIQTFKSTEEKHYELRGYIWNMMMSTGWDVQHAHKQDTQTRHTRVCDSIMEQQLRPTLQIEERTGPSADDTWELEMFQLRELKCLSTILCRVILM